MKAAILIRSTFSEKDGEKIMNISSFFEEKYCQ